MKSLNDMDEYGYPVKVIEHFKNPSMCGKMENPDGAGKAVSPGCQDTVWIYIAVNNEHISNISFQAYGCPSAIASASMVTVLALGKHIDQAAQIYEENVAQKLALFESKRECSTIAVRALHEAIYSYVFSNRERINSGKAK